VWASRLPWWIVHLRTTELSKLCEALPKALSRRLVGAESCPTVVGNLGLVLPPALPPRKEAVNNGHESRREREGTMNERRGRSSAPSNRFSGSAPPAWAKTLTSAAAANNLPVAMLPALSPRRALFAPELLFCETFSVLRNWLLVRLRW
jgi:hypothetical protein